MSKEAQKGFSADNIGFQMEKDEKTPFSRKT